MANENEFVLEREFNAPKSLMFKMWTEPKHLNNWWGAVGYKVEVAKMELKPGGTFLYRMKAPDGTIMYGKFVYREIVPDEKLVFVVSFSNAEEGITRHPMAPRWPLEMLSTLLLREENGKTILTMKATAINATAEEVKTFVDGFASMNMGWGGTLGQLDEYLKTIIS